MSFFHVSKNKRESIFCNSQSKVSNILYFLGFIKKSGNYKKMWKLIRISKIFRISEISGEKRSLNNNTKKKLNPNLPFNPLQLGQKTHKSMNVNLLNYQ